MKRIITLALAALLVLALGAGCTNTPAASSPPANASTAPAAASTAPGTSTAPEAPEEVEWEEITVSYGGLSADPAENAVGQFLMDKFKVKFVPIDTEGDKMKLLATTNDLPDVMGVTIGEGFFTMLREDGLIRSIPDEILVKYPFMQNLCNTAMNTSNVKAATGSFYTLPMRNDVDQSIVPLWHAFQYRTDWAEKVGITATPTNMDELAEMFRKFTFDDPTGTGATTYGFSGKPYGPAFYAWVDYDHWVYENGQWQPGYFTQAAREGLIYWSNLYKEGVIDPEFAAGGAQTLQLFHTDKIGTMMRRYDDYGIRNEIVNKFGPAHPEIEAQGLDAVLDTVRAIPALAKDANSEPKWCKNADDPYGKAFSAKVDDVKLERMLAYAEWLNTEGRDFRYYGFEGEDYKIEDGLAVITLPEGQLLHEKYTTQGMMDIAGYGFKKGMTPPKIPAVDPKITARADAHIAAVTPYLVDFNPAILTASTPAKDLFNVDTWEDEFMVIIASSGDAGVAFDSYIQQLKDIYNYDKVLEEVNALFPAP